MMLGKLGDFMVKRGGSVDPSQFKDEVFELLSIPAFDQGSPEILEGEKIGSPKKVVEPRDVLLSKIVPHIRRCWIVPKPSDRRQIASGEWIQFRGNNFSSEYLRFFLISDPFHSQFMKTVKGVGGSLLRASPEQVAQIEIPLPPLPDQIRIAHLLSRTERLIAQRKQHLQQLDDLLKSVFLEMFGDPVRNAKGWNKKQFSELLDDIESGKSPKCEAREAATDEWGVLKLGAVTRCRFNESENKALPQDVPPSVRDEVRAGDLLFSRKNTYDLVAACAYVFKVRPKLLMPDLIFRFVFNKNAEINPIFIWKLLTCDSQRKRIQSLAAGAAGSMPNISKANLKTVALPIPPLPLQNKFASIVEKIESIKSLYQQGLTDLEALYGALSQQAFKGELDLSRVFLPTQSIDPVALEEQATMPEPVVQTVTAIHLPDTEILLAALENSEARKALVAEWLEAYRQQLGNAPFSVREFMVAASDRLTEWLQTVVEDEAVADDQKNRLAEFYPSNDVALDVTDYEHIKKWVFEAVAAGTLTQGGNRVGNRIELKAVQS